MDADTRRTVLVFVTLAAAVGAVGAWWMVRQARAPRLVSAQVVYAWGAKGEASDQPGPVPADAPVTAYALVAFRRGEGGALRYLCPHPRVRLHGELLEILPPTAWPASGGVLRGLWLTLEPEFPGWAGVGPEDAHRMQYKEFLAPDLGRELQTEVRWEAYSDNFLARRLTGMGLPGGPYLLKVRVAAYANEHELVPMQWISSAGAENVWQAGVGGVIRDVELPGLDGRRAAPFFRLPCFTFAPGVWPDGGGNWPLPLTPEELVARRLVVTPASFAAAIAGGDPLSPPWSSSQRVFARGTTFVSASGTPLSWGAEVGPGDALRRGEAYFVLLADDGDGVLSLADQVAFAWMQPGYAAPLGVALASAGNELELLRLDARGRRP